MFFGKLGGLRVKKFWAIIMAALLLLGQAEVIEAAAVAKPAITNAVAGAKPAAGKGANA